MFPMKINYSDDLEIYFYKMEYMFVKSLLFLFKTYMILVIINNKWYIKTHILSRNLNLTLIEWIMK